jgi:PII-like signaling protein
MAEYLSQYRMINDYIEIRDGKIFNLAFDIDVYVENVSDNQIANNIINLVREYFDVNDYQMNQDIFLGRLQDKF